MSLTNCLTKAGNLLPPGDKSAILERAREYRQDGMSTTAAAARAVTEQLRQVQVDLDKAVRQDQESRQVKQSTKRDPQTETPAFKKWFGDSRLVDESGKPQVMYHGTSKAFTTVNMKKGAQGLFWMTSDKAAIEAGDVGAQGKGAVMPLYAAIQNPAGWKEYEQKSISELKRDGYDGIILPDSDGSKTAVIFDPKQVKSADKNNGDFDVTNKNITKSPARDTELDRPRPTWQVTDDNVPTREKAEKIIAARTKDGGWAGAVWRAMAGQDHPGHHGYATR